MNVNLESSKSDKWDLRFMRLAHHIAEWSVEHGRHVGAVIVGPDNEIRSTGFNGFPRGVDDNVPERHCRENSEKYFWSSHAERNAIYNAARIGVPLRGCRIYVPWFPCGECAKALIQSGIIEVIGYAPDSSDPKWSEDHRRVVVMLSEAGLSVRFMNPLQPLKSGG